LDATILLNLLIYVVCTAVAILGYNTATYSAVGRIRYDTIRDAILTCARKPT